MPILFRQTSHDIAFGCSPIEKMGGDNIVTYSMYGETPPIKETGSNFVFKLTEDLSNSNAYILINNNLYGIGRNDAYQFGPNNGLAKTYTLIANNVKDFSAVSNALYYIDTQNNLYGIGSNNKGQLGLGDTTTVTIFTKIASNVRKVQANQRNVAWYITNDGDLYMTGQNTYGQQGSGNTTDVLNFTKRLSNVRDIDMHTGSVTAVILENNDLYMCGYAQLWNQGNSRQTNYTSFHKVAENVKKVCADTEYCFYIVNDGLDTMYISGQLLSQQYKGFTSYATQINDIQIANNSHLGYLTNDGDLYLGGRNNYGECSTGSTSITTNMALRGGNVASIHLGQHVSWYIDNNGDLYGCGANDHGQQGTGAQTDVLTFAKRAENVKEVYTDISSTWYIDNNGDLYGCGGSYGLFPNTQSHVRTFTKVELPE